MKSQSSECAANAAQTREDAAEDNVPEGLVPLLPQATVVLALATHQFPD
jgi:hypothetical protein